MGGFRSQPRSVIPTSAHILIVRTGHQASHGQRSHMWFSCVPRREKKQCGRGIGIHLPPGKCCYYSCFTAEGIKALEVLIPKIMSFNTQCQ